MIIATLIFCQSLLAQNNYDDQVNSHLIEASKKMEIQQQKTQVDLEKNRPGYLEYNPPAAKKNPPFVAIPPKPKVDANIYQDQQFAPSTENDPSVQIEQDLETQRELANEQKKSRQQFIKDFENNAAKAGVKVQIDPDTLLAKPVK